MYRIQSLVIKTRGWIIQSIHTSTNVSIILFIYTPCKLHLVLQLKLRWLIRREELQRKRTNTAVFSVALQLIQSPSWQRALRYVPLFPSAIGPISRFLKNHWKGIIRYTIINHTLSYDNMNLNLFHIWQICENSANNRVVITRIICCGWRRNLV